MFRAEAGPRPDSPMTTPPLQTPSGLEAGRARRFARAGAARAEQAERRLAVPEGDAPRRTIRNRDRWFRVAVTLADVAAALMVVGLSTLWTPTSHLGWTALLLPLLVPVVNAANGLYQRDARVLNKSTLDEAPVLFRAATMTALIAFLIGSGLLEQPLGAKVVGFLWVALAVCVPAWRTTARAIVRELLPPERCLVLGDDARGLEIASKLQGTLGLKTDLVGVLPISASDVRADRAAGSGHAGGGRAGAGRAPHRGRGGRRLACGRARDDPGRQGARRQGQRAPARAGGRRLVGELRLRRRVHDPRRPAVRHLHAATACSSARSTSRAR